MFMINTRAQKFFLYNIFKVRIHNLEKSKKKNINIEEKNYFLAYT